MVIQIWPNFFRTVNAVQNSSLNQKLIRNHVKSLRTKYLIDNSGLGCTEYLIHRQSIQDNFEELSRKIKVKISDETQKNLSLSTINFGADIFITLNICPSFFVKLYWKAIYECESNLAQLASNIVRRAKGRFQIDALKIFEKISSVFGFQHISYSNERNMKIVQNIDLNENILNVSGESWA